MMLIKIALLLNGFRCNDMDDDSVTSRDDKDHTAIQSDDNTNGSDIVIHEVVLSETESKMQLKINRKMNEIEKETNEVELVTVPSEITDENLAKLYRKINEKEQKSLKEIDSIFYKIHQNLTWNFFDSKKMVFHKKIQMIKQKLFDDTFYNDSNPLDTLYHKLIYCKLNQISELNFKYKFDNCNEVWKDKRENEKKNGEYTKIRFNFENSGKQFTNLGKLSHAFSIFKNEKIPFLKLIEKFDNFFIPKINDAKEISEELSIISDISERLKNIIPLIDDFNNQLLTKKPYEEYKSSSEIADIKKLSLEAATICKLIEELKKKDIDLDNQSKVYTVALLKAIECSLKLLSEEKYYFEYYSLINSFKNLTFSYVLCSEDLRELNKFNERIIMIQKIMDFDKKQVLSELPKINVETTSTINSENPMIF